MHLDSHQMWLIAPIRLRQLRGRHAGDTVEKEHRGKSRDRSANARAGNARRLTGGWEEAAACLGWFGCRRSRVRQEQRRLGALGSGAVGGRVGAVATSWFEGWAWVLRPVDCNDQVQGLRDDPTRCSRQRADSLHNVRRSQPACGLLILLIPSLPPRASCSCPYLAPPPALLLLLRQISAVHTSHRAHRPSLSRPSLSRPSPTARPRHVAPLPDRRAVRGARARLLPQRQPQRPQL